MRQERICQSCQEPVGEDSNFCSSCGTKYVEPKIKSKPKPQPSQSYNKSSSAANDNIKLIAGIVIGILVGGIAGFAFIDDGSTTISSLELGIDALESEKNQLLSKNNELTSNINDVSTELELSIQTANNEKSELNAQLSQIKNEKDSLETQVSDLDGQITELNSEIQELNDEVADLNVEVLKAAQVNALIPTLESQISELERLKSSLQMQINDSDARILSLENSIADKDALIASYENTIDIWENHNLNLYEAEIVTETNVIVPANLCWNVWLYKWNEIDTQVYSYMTNYNGYFILTWTSTEIVDVYLIDNDGWWTNEYQRTSDVVIIPHTPDTMISAELADDWEVRICSANGNPMTLSYSLVFRF